MWRWFSPELGLGLAGLTTCQLLLHGSAAASEQPAFLHSWCPALLPALVRVGDEAGFAQLVSLLRTSPAALISKYFEHCFAVCFAASKVGARGLATAFAKGA